MRGILCSVLVVMALPAHAEDAPTTSPEAIAAMNAQQLFNAASTAAAADKCKEALPLFDALVRRPAVAGNARVLATSRLRRVPCLVADARYDEAVSDLRSALEVIPMDDSLLRVDIALAYTALGRMKYSHFEYEDAARDLDAALALLRPSEQYEQLKWLAQSTMFEPGRRAIDATEKMMTMAGEIPDISKPLLANVRTLHARALLNHGEARAAYDELRRALADKGGLKLTVDMGDVETRADLALAALMIGKKAEARDYMAYTGAGRFEKAPFVSARTMDPPPCGGPAGLAPEDMAVIEFSIADTGEVMHAMPVYATRNGQMAAEFARAVAGWSWKPEDVAAIPPFFRLLTRVEVRCQTATAHPDALDLLMRDVVSFLGAKGVAPFDGDVGHRAGLESAKARVAELQAAGHGIEAVPVLLAMEKTRLVDPDERARWLGTARGILADAGAPVAALTYLDIRQQFIGWYLHGDAKHWRAYLRSLLAEPARAADARAAALLRLLIAEPHYDTPAPTDAKNLLLDVATNPALPESDPLRVGALVRLASLEAAAGDLPAARSSYEKTGLTAQQCSIVDATPVMRRLGHSDFPIGAEAWGFEGWVMLEFDIQADGKTANQRALIAYPPLVFVDTAINMAKDSTYSQSYRPAGGLGCGGKVIKASFSMR